LIVDEKAILLPWRTIYGTEPDARQAWIFCLMGTQAFGLRSVVIKAG